MSEQSNIAPVRLGLNVDHVATLRNARGGTRPDPVRAAQVAVAAGADGITAHLREDRRHIADHDIERLKAEVPAPLNLEMAVTPEMIAIARKVRPNASCLVPERRAELTTEGGLDVAGNFQVIAAATADLLDAGIRVSLFVDPVLEQIGAAVKANATIVELHTGAYCEAHLAADEARARAEFERLKKAAGLARQSGLEVHAGHGLDFETGEHLASLAEVVELNIGHFLIGEAVFVGLPAVIASMREALRKGRARIGAVNF